MATAVQRVAITLALVAMLVLAGCSSIPGNDAPDGPEQVDEQSNAPGDLTYFTAEVEGQTYICIVYERRVGIGETTRGFAGMSCDPVGEDLTQ